MRIDALLQAGLTRSFEFFPPKSEAESVTLDETFSDLEILKPSFVSVTYRGGAESRQRTYDLVSRIHRDHNITSMAHMICVGHKQDEVERILHNYAEAGVENIMALGGDVPSGSEDSSDFAYAIDLVSEIRHAGTFAIGVAAHPLGHPKSPTLDSDREFLALKLELADFAVTQFFFQADEWKSLVNDLADRNCHKPVLPGIMPVTSLSSIPSMARMGSTVPPELVVRLEAANESGGPEAVREAGISAAVELCRDLLAEHAPGLHFYTLNRSTATREIHDALFN
ncbi:MAG: methylenetetrahydrofolate reductase [Actinomycetota bacterium]